MNNEELKKKIVEILKKTMEPIEYGGDSEHAPEVHYPTEEEIADALIAAGIGDVKTIQEIAASATAMAVLEAAKAEHRAEVAERKSIVLSKWLADKTRKDYPYQAWLEAAQKQAEKELAEEKKE